MQQNDGTYPLYGQCDVCKMPARCLYPSYPWEHFESEFLPRSSVSHSITVYDETIQSISMVYGNYLSRYLALETPYDRAKPIPLGTRDPGFGEGVSRLFDYIQARAEKGLQAFLGPETDDDGLDDAIV